MPVILQREEEDIWLNPDIIEPERLHPLLTQYPSSKMAMYAVSRSVNIPTIDREEIIKPVEMNSQ